MSGTPWHEWWCVEHSCHSPEAATPDPWLHSRAHMDGDVSPFTFVLQTFKSGLGFGSQLHVAASAGCDAANAASAINSRILLPKFYCGGVVQEKKEHDLVQVRVDRLTTLNLERRLLNLSCARIRAPHHSAARTSSQHSDRFGSTGTACKNRLSPC